VEAQDCPHLATNNESTKTKTLAKVRPIPEFHYPKNVGLSILLVSAKARLRKLPPKHNQYGGDAKHSWHHIEGQE